MTIRQPFVSWPACGGGPGDAERRAPTAPVVVAVAGAAVPRSADGLGHRIHDVERTAAQPSHETRPVPTGTLANSL